MQTDTEQLAVADRLSLFRVDRHLQTGYFQTASRADAHAGLTATPKTLPAHRLRDEAGWTLLEQLAQTPEHYLGRAEQQILSEHVAEIATLARADRLVALGSGSPAPMWLVLDALWATDGLRTFSPFDVSEDRLAVEARAIQRDYDGLAVHAVIGDVEHHLRFVPRGGQRLIALLGGQIGALPPLRRAALLSELADGMGPQDALLMSVDLAKDPGRLLAAYDDAAGVAAALNKNALAVMNARLGAAFDLDAFEHAVRWDAESASIETLLRASRTHAVRIEDLRIDVPFAAGEELRTGVSAVFTRETVEEELRSAGLSIARWWTDAAGDVALTLSFPDVRA